MRPPDTTKLSRILSVCPFVFFLPMHRRNHDARANLELAHNRMHDGQISPLSSSNCYGRTYREAGVALTGARNERTQTEADTNVNALISSTHSMA
jgi:hypothetical protein